MENQTVEDAIHKAEDMLHEGVAAIERDERTQKMNEMIKHVVSEIWDQTADGRLVENLKIGWNNLTPLFSSQESCTRIAICTAASFLTFRTCLFAAPYVGMLGRFSSSPRMFGWKLQPIHHAHSYVFGMTAVGGAGYLSTLAFLEADKQLSEYNNSHRYFRFPEPRTVPLWEGFVIFGSLISFRLMRGFSAGFFNTSYRSVWASDVFHEGAYAVRSLPSKADGTLSPTDVSVLQRWGKKYGCHTCGRRFMKRIEADNIPPLRYAYRKVKLWPQCEHCLGKQRAAFESGKRTLVPHVLFSGTRLWHFPIPLPLAFILLQPFLDSLKKEEEKPASWFSYFGL